MTNEKAPERIYMHPTSAEANVNPSPLEPGEYVEYVRADLLTTAHRDETVLGLTREDASNLRETLVNAADDLDTEGLGDTDSCIFARRWIARLEAALTEK